MGLLIGIAFKNSDHKGLKNSRFSLNGLTTRKNLRCETLHIADYKEVNISSFSVLDIKLWLSDGELNISVTPYIHSN